MPITRVATISEDSQRLSSGTSLKAWRIPQCPCLIECSSAVLEQVRLQVERGRNLPGGEQETGGVLFGIQEPNRICILASTPLQCEHAMGPGFVLSEGDEKRLVLLMSAPTTAPELNGLQVIGWYHSHIRSPGSRRLLFPRSRGRDALGVELRGVLPRDPFARGTGSQAGDGFRAAPVTPAGVVPCEARAAARGDLSQVRQQAGPAVTQDRTDRAASRGFRLLPISVSRVPVTV